VELGRVGVLLHAEFLQRVDRGLNPGAALVLFGDVDPVEQEAGLAAADAAHDVAVDDLGAHQLRVPGRREQRHAGRQPGELVKAPAVQRQVDDLLVRDHLAERGRFRVEERRLGRDHHLGRQGAEREHELDARRLADRQLDVLADRCLKARDRRGDPIHARVERRDGVVPLTIGGRRSHHVGRDVRDGHGHIGDAGALRVVDGADDAGTLQLGKDGTREGERDDDQTSETSDKPSAHGAFAPLTC